MAAFLACTEQKRTKKKKINTMSRAQGKQKKNLVPVLSNDRWQIGRCCVTGNL